MSKFTQLSKKIQSKEGKSKESADAIAAVAGIKKMGKEKFEEKAKSGRKKSC